MVLRGVARRGGEEEGVRRRDAVRLRTRGDVWSVFVRGGDERDGGVLDLCRAVRRGIVRGGVRKLVAANLC